MNLIRRRRTNKAKAKKAVRTAQKAVKAWAVYKTLRRFTPRRLAFALVGMVATALLGAFAKRKAGADARQPSGAVPAPTPPPADPDQAEARYVQTQTTGV